MRRYENERHNGDGTYNDCFWKKKRTWQMELKKIAH